MLFVLGIQYFAFACFVVYYGIARWQHGMQHVIIGSTIVFLTALSFACVLYFSIYLGLVDRFLDVAVTRCGRVTESGASIWVRYPGLVSDADLILQLYFKEQSAMDEDWMQGAQVHLNYTNDWTGMGALTELKSSTAYDYTWMLREESGDVHRVLFPGNGRMSDTKSLLNRFHFHTSPLSTNNATAMSVAFGNLFRCYAPPLLHPYDVNLTLRLLHHSQFSFRTRFAWI